MSSKIIQILEALLSLGIAFLCVRLSKYRYQENEKYAVKYENNTKMLIFRLIITYSILLQYPLFQIIHIKQSLLSGYEKSSQS